MILGDRPAVVREGNPYLSWALAKEAGGFLFKSREDAVRGIRHSVQRSKNRAKWEVGALSERYLDGDLYIDARINVPALGICKLAIVGVPVLHGDKVPDMAVATDGEAVTHESNGRENSVYVFVPDAVEPPQGSIPAFVFVSSKSEQDFMQFDGDLVGFAAPVREFKNDTLAFITNGKLDALRVGDACRKHDRCGEYRMIHNGSKAVDSVEGDSAQFERIPLIHAHLANFFASFRIALH